MKLYVMRHGIAEDDSSDGTDASRALVAVGRSRTRQVAELLLAEGEAPEWVVSSPLVRALQTAEIVHAHCGVKAPVEVTPRLSPGGDAESFVRDAARSGRKRLMVVGHEPDLTTLVAALAGAPARHGFDKSMVIGLRILAEGNPAEVRFILDPKALTVQRFTGA